MRKGIAFLSLVAILASGCAHKRPGQGYGEYLLESNVDCNLSTNWGDPVAVWAGPALCATSSAIGAMVYKVQHD